jgi:hypothetical protein
MSVLKFSGCGKAWLLFTDNDGHPPTVWTRPATQQPLKVKIGTMTVTYVATDASRHKTKCNFTIKIEGEKSPMSIPNPLMSAPLIPLLHHHITIITLTTNNNGLWLVIRALSLEILEL